MVDDLRSDLHGFSFEQDRLWRITGPDFVGAMTDYNDEITGYTPNLKEHFNDGDIHYGGNAYYVTMEAVRRGYKVEHVDDRR